MAFVNTVRDGTGDGWHMLGDGLGRPRMYDDWTPELQSDVAANDSDKTFTVPALTQWRIKSIWCDFTSSAGVGNRQMTIEIQDGAANVLGRVKAGIVQAASLTRYYLFAPHVTELTAFRDTSYLTTIMPEWTLPTTYVVRVWDSAAIDAAADDLIIRMLIESRPTA
jgi:hypothetical protein